MSHITASKKRTPAKVWVGVFAIGLVLLVMPFLLGATAGQGWIRILNFALLYVMLALGLNIIGGRVVCKPVADAWGLPYEPLVL